MFLSTFLQKSLMNTAFIQYDADNPGYRQRINKILLIDEIETQLHIKLVEYIIGLFNKSESAQLIYTTHNTYLLNTNKLRKDQIYFVNKRDDGSSDLYSLFDYKDFRDGLDAEKAYLQGRFDAIPYIDEQTDNFIK